MLPTKSTGILLTALLIAVFASRSPTPAAELLRQRRILYNFDGDSCMSTRAASQGPVATTVDDLKTLISEIAYAGSQVDTMLVCTNAQVMYYPTQVGTMRGALSTAAQREDWPALEKQRFKNIKRFFEAGIDPYAIMLAEAKQQGLEALLTFRMNDDHGNDFLRTQFKQDHPGYGLKSATSLDFVHQEVRDYVFLLIQEAARRYKCDGMELDFNRFPRFFGSGTTEERVARMNSLVQRVRAMLDKVGLERGRRLVLGVRVPTNNARSSATLQASREIGCDVLAWTKNGWVDFVTVSEFLFVNYDLPLQPWTEAIRNVPVYGGIECVQRPGRKEDRLTPDKYRRAAWNRWRDGADGVYLFNFFTTREHPTDAHDPPFQVLKDLGDRKALLGF
jgi:hypothetical protein